MTSACVGATAAAIAMFVAGASCVFAAAGAEFPSRPVRLIVPFGAGGGTDITARSIALKLGQAWSQSVVVDNRPGANGTIALDIAARSAPDGHTLTMVSSSHSVNVSLYRNLPYDLTRDFSPITQVTAQAYALVIYPGVPAKSVKELIALAKARPGTLNYGSSGTGGLSHLAGALLATLASIDIAHVPYKGGTPGVTDLIAGQIQMLFATILQSHAHIKAGRLRALAVTSAKRAGGAPELPTMQEAGVAGYEVVGWYGVMAPARTPAAVVAKLNGEIVRIVRSAEMKERLSADGSDPVGSTPQQFGTHVASEIAKWRRVIKDAGIRLDH